MEELKRCPFCGSDDVVNKGAAFLCAVYCNNCGADVIFDRKKLIKEYGPPGETQWQEAVTRGWNRREPAQPKRKQGRWVNRSLNILYPESTRYICSVCGKYSYSYDFCPNCGADMRGE